MTHIDALEGTLHKTNRWLTTVEHSLGGEAGKRIAYASLRAVLHALRDRLTVDDVAHLGAQLPMLVRGIYYEGWHPSGKPLRLRHTDEFLDVVMQHLGPADVDAEDAARAVFNAMQEHLDPGEIAKVVNALPNELRELWRPPVEARDT